MNKVFYLIKLFIQQRFSLPEIKKNNIVKSIIFLIMISVFIFAAIYIENKLFGFFKELNEEKLLLHITWSVANIVTLVASFFFIMSSLYYCKDGIYLSALPVSSRKIMSARLVDVLISELAFDVLIMLPAIILVGNSMGQNIMFYIRSIIIMLLIPILPVCIVTIISSAIIKISKLWHHNDTVTIIMSFAIVFTLMYFYMNWVMQNSQKTMVTLAMQILVFQQSISGILANSLPPFKWSMDAIFNTGISAWISILYYLLLSLSAFVLVVTVFGSGYQKSVVKFVEQKSNTKKLKNIKGINNKKAHSQYFRLISTEFKILLITPAYAVNGLSSILFVLIMPVFMIVGINRNPGAYKQIIDLIPNEINPLILCIFFAVFALMGSINPALSTSVSREGNAHEIYRTLPVRPTKIVNTKLIMGVIISLASTIPSMVLISVYINKLIPTILIAALLAIMVILASCMFSLIIDSIKPKFTSKNETQAIKQNVNSLFSMAVFLILTAVPCIAFYFCDKYNLNRISEIVILSLVCLIEFIAAVFTYVKKGAKIYINKEV